MPTLKHLTPFAVFVFAILIATELQASTETQADEASPNILFIYLDDYGWKDAGFMGSDFYETPNIDSLAHDSMVFTNAYSCCANCAPARASLLSGQYTPRHKVFNVGTQPRGKAKDRKLEHIAGTDTLDPNIKTWAKCLQESGYVTATMGKWHLSKDPIPYGFDVNVGGNHRGGPPKGYYPPHPNAPGLQQAAPNEYLTDRLSDEAVKFIRSHKDKKWCLYLTHFAVHTPIQAKRELLAKYQNKPKGKLHGNSKMGTMIESVDQGIGKIVAALKELKLFDNTVIIFSSDNGGYGPATDMDPLKGYKGTFYEGGIRVPFFVHWPGKINPGKIPTPINGVDVFPTLCEIGQATMPDQVCDGLSLMPLLTAKPGSEKRAGSATEQFQDRPLFWHFPCYLQSYRNVTDEQRDPRFRTRPCSVIRKGNWKLIQFFEKGDFELYNLADDIGETKNLAVTAPAKLNELRSELSSWQKTTNAPIPKRK